MKPYLQKDAVVRKLPDDSEIVPLVLIEKKAIETALRNLGGNISKVASALGIGNAILDTTR